MHTLERGGQMINCRKIFLFVITLFSTGFYIDSFDISPKGKPIVIKKKNMVYLLTGVCLVDTDEITVSFGIYPNKIAAILASIIKSIQKNKRIGEKFYVDDV